MGECWYLVIYGGDGRDGIPRSGEEKDGASDLQNNQVVMRDLARDRTLGFISPSSSGSP